MFEGLLGDKEALLALAAQLMQAKKGQEVEYFGKGLMSAMQARHAGEDRKQKGLLQAQHMERGNLELEQLRRQQQNQQRRDELPGQFFGPQPSPHGPMPDGGSMPQLPSRNDHAGYANALRAFNPGEAQAYEVQQAQLNQKQQPKYHVVKGSLVPEPQGPGMKSEPVFTAPEKEPDWMNPRYVEVKKEIAAAGRPQVTVDTRQENEFNKKMGAQFAENYNNVLTSGFQAQSKLRDLQRFENILSKVPTGKLEPIKSEVGKLAASLGVKVDTEKLGFQEAMDSLSNQYALTLRNPANGAGMPGALSDKDREFLVSIVPGLGKTPGGNLIIVEAQKRVAQREMEVAKLARAYKAKTGKFDEGFYEVLSREFGDKDIMSDLAATVAQRGGVSVGGTILRFDRNGNPI